MCLIVFAHHVSEHIPLAIAANRDEFHQRATAPGHFWDEHKQLLAGKDLELGGTWLGITRTGRFAAVTNFRDPDKTIAATRSRGELPLNFLLGTASPEQYLSSINKRAPEYAGFNLLVGTQDALWYLSNAPGDEPLSLPPGIYGLSNARLNTPWPKAEQGKQKLAQIVAAGEISHDTLASVVSDRRLADKPEPSPATTASSMDHLLSGQFIVGEHYGTRCTTTLWTSADQHSYWQELSFDNRGCVQHTRTESFALASAD